MHVPLALGQTNVLSLYYLWAALDILRTAVDMKQLINAQSKAFSSEPDADYRCHQTRALIAHTPSFDATSCLHWSRRLRSAGMAIVICPRGEREAGVVTSGQRKRAKFGNIARAACDIRLCWHVDIIPFSS